MKTFAAFRLAAAVLVLLLASCKEKPASREPEHAASGFTILSSGQTGLAFTNTINDSPELNYFNYQYLYNGGGVAAGDINGDGLPDLFFTANMGPNRLYLNKSGLQFEDITQSAGVAGHTGWTTGCAMLDINEDGLLDIYVCYSGRNPKDQRRNELFINLGNGKFRESAAAYGLDDPGYSTQIYPIDYDLDGDPDLFLLSHRVDFYNTGSVLNPDPTRTQDEPNTDKLFRNNGDGTFTNVTAEAGLINRAFGLSATIMDFNEDGWPDIYVANDFLEPDMLYINNGNGTFTERCNEMLRHVSFYGMGSDAADINNDGHSDLYVLDMAPPEHAKSKRLMASMSTEGFWKMIQFGYNYQYMINTLQLNRGRGHFSEIAQMAGLDKTDWSWAPLFLDFDNDGWQDAFVTNGIKYDVTDNDFKIWLQEKIAAEGQALDFNEVMSRMPRSEVANFFLRNEGNLHFRKMNAEWGLTATQHSNGAAWADLDGDGDQDLVVNNVDQPVQVYRNDTHGNHYLKLRFEGPEGNRWGIGARVELVSKNGIQAADFYWVRGYQSSVEPVMHFGLGSVETVSEIRVTWPDGKVTRLLSQAADRTLTIRYADAGEPENEPETAPLFRLVQPAGLAFTHREQPYDDFARELLLPHKESESGPRLSAADVDGDGLQDLFIGGAAGQAGRLFLQNPDGSFSEAPAQPWERHSACEDLGSLFFDADGDGDPDLYVCSGSNEFDSTDQRLQDRLYLNDGHGRFTWQANALPRMISSTACVTAADIDGDGDQDLFVGGRVTPGKYPFPPRSWLLRNDGGKFTDITRETNPALLRPGMVTSACFADADGNGTSDLLLAGEWMPLRLFLNQNSTLAEAENAGFDSTSGWWFSITPADLDGDGDVDFIAGNIGLNNKFHPSPRKPFHVFCSDFDHNGTFDIVLATSTTNRNFWPVRGRECSSQQMPFIKQKFPTYKSFAEAYLTDIYSPEALDSAFRLDAYEFRSCILRNDGSGHFTLEPLPPLAQIAPVMASVVTDLNGDGLQDLVIAGNWWGAEVETVRYDAGLGLCLLGDGQGGFTPVPASESGLYTNGNVHGMAWLPRPDGGRWLVTGSSNGPVEVWEIK